MLKTVHLVAALVSLATPVMPLVSSTVAAQTEVSSASAVEKVGGVEKFGVGIDLSYRFTGLMFNYFVTERSQIQLELGYHATPGSFDLTQEADRGLGVRGMYLGYPAVLSEGRGYSLPFFIGVGASYAFNVQESLGWFAGDEISADSDILTAFVPVGLQLRMRGAPLSFFAQFEPAVEFVREPGELLRDAAVNFSPRLGVGGAIHF